MDFDLIREYLVDDLKIQSLVGDNIFLVDRPEKCKCNDYITYNPKELGNVGYKVKKYQLDFRIISKDKLKLLAIKQRLIELLDHQDQATRISKEDGVYIYTMKLMNGGGIAKAENGDYYAFLYFFAII